MIDYSRINSVTNNEIHRLSLKIGNGITTREVGKLIELIRHQLYYVTRQTLPEYNDDDVIDDLVGSIILRILSSLDKFDSTKGKFTTWAWTICYRCSVQFRKDDVKLKTVSISAIGLDGAWGANKSITAGRVIIRKCSELINLEDPEYLYIEAEDEMIEQEYIDKIKEFTRDISIRRGVDYSFLLKHIMLGRTRLVDAARTLGWSAQTVKNRCFQLRKKIRDGLQAEFAFQLSDNRIIRSTK